jgi:bacillithiol synthase
MDCRPISYERVPKASALFQDYLYHFDRVSRFYENSPFEPGNFKKVSDGLAYPDKVRREMAAILARQNRAFGCGQPTLDNIELFSKPGTVAVVTGQQVGFVSGPAFTLYKALTTVKLVQSIRDQGLQVVPIFWLATEDHDLEEVASTSILNDEYEPVTYGDPGVSPAPRSAVGRIRLSEAISSTLDQLGAQLPPGDSKESLLQELRDCYQPGATWGEAFGKLMTHLFGRWGVILLDPLDDVVHSLAANVYMRALAEAPAMQGRLLDRSEALERAGYHAQVHVNQDSTLLFLTSQGNRFPLHLRDGKFLIDGHESISLDDLLKVANERPLDLSSNVLLRPLVQDSILPTVAYVAGPSELAYFGQAQVLYEAFERPQPVVFPRAAFTLVDRRVRRLMEKYNLTLEDAWQGKEHLSTRIAATGFSGGGAEGWSERFDRNERELAALLERLRQDVESLDRTLLDTLKHTEEKIRYQMERLRGKISRAALQNSDLLARHNESILRLLTSHQDLQEREVCGIYFLGRAGTSLLERLLAQIQTTSSEHIEFDY